MLNNAACLVRLLLNSNAILKSGKAFDTRSEGWSGMASYAQQWKQPFWFLLALPDPQDDHEWSLWDGLCFLHRAHVLLMFLWNCVLFSTQTALPPILSSRLCSLPSKDLSSLLIANLSTEDRLPTICCISVCRLSLMSSQFSVSLLWEHSSLCVSLLGSQCRPRARKSQIPCQQETSQSSYHYYHSNKTNKTNKTTD